MGGNMQGRLSPRNDEERAALEDAGYDVDRVYGIDDLVSGEEAFFAATGITDGFLLRGVRYRAREAVTYSMVMRSKSGTIRIVEARHQLEKLMRFSEIEYD
jgi:fructose-1,6-bisphosphatase II